MHLFCCSIFELRVADAPLDERSGILGAAIYGASRYCRGFGFFLRYRLVLGILDDETASVQDGVVGG